MQRFAGKVVVVTGGAGGIGLETIRRFRAEGAVTVSAERHGDPPCDVSDEAQVEHFVATVLARHGRLDVVVNNAGIMLFKPLEHYTGADWHQVLGVDLMGAVHFTRQAFLHMQPGGAVVNVASVHAAMTTPLVAPYAAAKAALLSLTRSAAIEGKARGIRANAVLPGAVETPMLRENPNIKSGAEQLNEADVGQPADIAAAIAFLASAEARFITGACLAVDGGRLAQL
jgi:NAD(P)-dependent dehydrogenase (short-subunit alcohol dehydrogenase family)